MLSLYARSLCLANRLQLLACCMLQRLNMCVCACICADTDADRDTHSHCRWCCCYCCCCCCVARCICRRLFICFCIAKLVAALRLAFWPTHWPQSSCAFWSAHLEDTFSIQLAFQCLQLKCARALRYVIYFCFSNLTRQPRPSHRPAPTHKSRVSVVVCVEVASASPCFSFNFSFSFALRCVWLCTFAHQRRLLRAFVNAFQIRPDIFRYDIYTQIYAYICIWTVYVLNILSTWRITKLLWKYVLCVYLWILYDKVNLMRRIWELEVIWSCLRRLI